MYKLWENLQMKKLREKVKNRIMILPVKQLEEKLHNMTDELSKEKDPQKQQEMLKTINLLIDTISKLKN